VSGDLSVDRPGLRNRGGPKLTDIEMGEISLAPELSNIWRRKSDLAQVA
jgi:hypothetical protein